MAEEVSVTDLEKLWKAGAVNLQAVAAQFSQSASHVHKTALSEHQVFSGATRELVTAWNQIRNQLQDEILVKSYENCTKSGNTLANIAISISEQDSDNKERLAETIDEIENSPVLDDRPPSVPEAPSSDDPHPDTRHGPELN